MKTDLTIKTGKALPPFEKAASTCLCPPIGARIHVSVRVFMREELTAKGGMQKESARVIRDGDKK